MHVDIKQFQTRVLKWYRIHGRHELPWQKLPSPYKVWLSEVMLQQTQVKTVIPYYKRFIKQFPTIQSLAKASIDEVFSLWSGLGYYRRARYLHEASKILCKKYHHKFPTDLTQLQDLPGVGRSTAGAILSMGYNQPAAILDGNVKRLFSRFFAIGHNLTNHQMHNQLWEIAETYKSETHPAHYSQALMDLGATCCTAKSPHCNQCPLKSNCKARLENTIHLYPSKILKKKIPVKHFNFHVFIRGETLLLIKRPHEGIWGNLWCFPEDKDLINLPSINRYMHPPRSLQSFKHLLTHFELHIHPKIYQLKSKKFIQLSSLAQSWYTIKEINQLAIPKPVVMILQSLPKMSIIQPL